MDRSKIPELSKDDLVSQMDKYKGRLCDFPIMGSFKELGAATGYHGHLSPKQTEMFLSQITKEININIADANEVRAEIYSQLEKRFLEILEEENNQTVN